LDLDRHVQEPTCIGSRQVALSLLHIGNQLFDAFDDQVLAQHGDLGVPGAGRDLWLLPIEGDRTPRPLLQTNADEYEARVSPDGRWIAYTSDENGQREVYISPFPTMSAKRQISLAGGISARWR